MSTIINHTTSLETLDCCHCGMALALSSKWIDEARTLGGFKQKFWCPYCGYSQGWGTSQHEKQVQELKSQLSAAQSNQEYYKRRAVDARTEAEHFRKSRDGFKGVLTKVKRRVANGVCPCCTRTFTNLARHMASQHPEHVNESTLSRPEGI